MTTKKYQVLKNYIEANTLRFEASHRGGGIEIDASGYLKKDGAKITAYQNYLGGGLLGSIGSSQNFYALNRISKRQEQRLDELTEALQRYYHEVTNTMAEEWDVWASGDFEAIQNRPASGY